MAGFPGCAPGAAVTAAPAFFVIYYLSDRKDHCDQHQPADYKIDHFTPLPIRRHTAILTVQIVSLS